MTTKPKPWIRWLVMASLVVAAFVLGVSLRGGSSPGGTAPMATEAADTIWTCSMHPQIQLPQPGACPICGMDLIPLTAGADESSSGPASLTLGETARQLAQIRTSRVRRESVRNQVRMVGKLEADETRVRKIAAWVPGRIDRLYVDFTGVPIRAGAKLFDLYSPELFSAQEALLQSVRAAKELERSTLESTEGSSVRMIEAARERLRLWGLTPEQVEAIEGSGRPSDHVTIVAPTSGVVLEKHAVEGAYVQTGSPVYSIADLSVLWLKLNAYESDLAWIKESQSVEFETEAFPGESFEGTVSFVDPMVDERTRTVKVRVNVPNPGGKLRPGMFVRATLLATVGTADGGTPLVIPDTAPLVTGKRAVVYVAHPTEPGRFDGREVTLGARAGDVYVVRDGLAEGEWVVTNGAFKIDSALQIRAKSSMMNPGGGGPAPGHDHGGAALPASEQATRSPEPISGVPESFRLQVEALLGQYYAVSDALSHDDLATAKTAAAKLSAVLEGTDPSSLPADAQSYWAADSRALRQTARLVADASQITAARDAFYDLSMGMIRTARRFGTTGATPVRVFHCPMAMGGAGADWLQSKEGTENPYYGSQMFRCGSQTEVLGQVSAKPDGQEGHDGGHSGAQGSHQ